MPAYVASSNPVAAYPGDSVTVWNVETPTTGTASQQIAIGSIWENNPGKMTVEIKFSADPGAFQIDTQVADTDTANAYITPGSYPSVTSVNAGFYARVDLYPVVAKFARLVMTTQTANAVTVVAKLSR